MSGPLWVALGVLGPFGIAALGDMVSEEVRDRLDHLPHAILRLAARLLDPAQCTVIFDDEWMPELAYILKGDEARPVTRLFHGTRYALGILFRARRIAGYLDRVAAPEPPKAVHLVLQFDLPKQAMGIKGLGNGDTIRVGFDGPGYLVLGKQSDGTPIIRKVMDGKPGCADFPSHLLKPVKNSDLQFWTGKQEGT